ncbi:MAG: c-type cytochrome [Burkholderiaceae bacterium]
MSHDQHSSWIKTPKQLIIVVVLAFAVPIFLILLLATYVVGDQVSGAGSDAMTAEAISNRLRPVGTVVLAGAAAPRALQGGEAVYKLACAVCHTAGAAGAPKTGDKAAWTPRLKQGFDTLVKHAVEGFKTMPAKGGNADLDSIEVARAVAFMANQAGAKFSEPAAPAAPAATAAAVSTPVAAAAVTAASTAPTSVAAAAAPKGAAPDAAKIYASSCAACHVAGIAGAPKFGDKAAWAPRAKNGIDALTATVIAGKGAMPPRGGVATATDADLRATVEYMLAAAR